MRRLRRLSEVECYTRCYGVDEPTVRVVRRESRRRRVVAVLAGDRLRALFEERLDAREPEAA